MRYNNEYILKILQAEGIDSAEIFNADSIEDVNVDSIEEEKLLSAFTELRLKIGEHFKLSNVSFLLGNGCSIYAGSKSTTAFSLEKILVGKNFDSVNDIVSSISSMDMEQQLNALVTVRDYYKLVDDEKGAIIEEIINDIKDTLLSDYVNTMDYNSLSWHEIMLLKLRSYNCLARTQVFTLNYDLAFEYLLDKLGIDYSNGFTGFVNRRFDSKSLKKGDRLNLIKLHGSINWSYDESEGAIKEKQPSFLDGHISIDATKQVLIYPTAEKLYQTFSEPYSELMRFMLNEFEARQNVIFVLGYKYGDEHINDILLKAISNPNNIFYFFDYDNNDSPFIKKMEQLSENVQSINILYGNFLASFDTFVKYLMPTTAEKTDEERIIELLKKVMREHVE